MNTFIHYAFTSHITTDIKYHSPSNSRLKFHSFTESWAQRYKYIVFAVRFNHFPVGHQQHFLLVSSSYRWCARLAGRVIERSDRSSAIVSKYSSGGQDFNWPVFLDMKKMAFSLESEREKEMQRDWMGTRRWSGMMENHAFLVFSDSFFWVQVWNHFNFSPWFIVAAVVRGEPSKKKKSTLEILALKSSDMGPSHLYIWSGRQ